MTAFLRVLRLQFFDVLHQLVLIGQTAEIEADHLVRAERTLLARPKGNQHAGNDRAVRLDLDAVLVMTQKVTAAQDVLK